MISLVIVALFCGFILTVLGRLFLYSWIIAISSWLLHMSFMECIFVNSIVGIVFFLIGGFVFYGSFFLGLSQLCKGK